MMAQDYTRLVMALERAADRLYLKIEATKDRSTVARLTRRREALLAEVRQIRRHLLA